MSDTEGTATPDDATAEQYRLSQAEALLRELGFVQQPGGSWEPTEE